MFAPVATGKFCACLPYSGFTRPPVVAAVPLRSNPLLSWIRGDSIPAPGAVGRSRLVRVFKCPVNPARSGRFNPNSEAGLSVAATPRRRKVQATPSSPVVAAIMPLPEKMRRGRRYHPVATRRRRYFRPAASEFRLKSNQPADGRFNLFWQGQFLNSLLAGEIPLTLPLDHGSPQH